MGCCASRKPFLDEENLLQLAEKQLELHTNSPQDVTAVFKELSPSLSQTEFELAATRLHVPSAVLRDRETSTSRFFRSLRQNDCYESRKLQLLCILLSSGSTFDKAEAYFDTVDVSGSGTASKASVRLFLDTVTDLLVRSLPLLVRDIEGRIRRVVEFERRLKIGRAQAVATLEARIMRQGNAISRQGFCARFSDDQVEALTSALRLRQFVLYGRESLCLKL